MDGPGPALDFLGTHEKPAGPLNVDPAVWQRERMPTVSHLEIEGRHPEADGIRMNGVMQPVLCGLLVRHVRVAVHLTGRARNALIDHCHIYDARHAGIHLDGVNLHQINVTGNHLSFCRLGAIRVEHSQIRNLQITGNDIEYNNRKDHPNLPADETADIWIDTRDGVVREGTIVSNTIQATPTPGGASIRFIGRGAHDNHCVGLFSITGNLIGSQERNIHLTDANRVVVSGNCIYGTTGHSVLVERSQFITLTANTFGNPPEYNCVGCSLRFEDCSDCVCSGMILQDCWKERTTQKVQQGRQALIEMVRCRRMTLNAVQVLDAVPDGMLFEDCSDTLVSACTVMETRDPSKMDAAIRWSGNGSNNLIAHCRLAAGRDGAVLAPAHVRCETNV